MRVKLAQLPFVRLLIPFALGIIAELYFTAHSLFLYVALFSVFFLFLWNWREKSKGAVYSLRWISGALAAIVLFVSGYCMTLLHTPSENKAYVGHSVGEEKDSMMVTLVSIPQEKQKTYKATGEITALIKNGISCKTTGKALFYFHKDSIAEKLNYGDELLICSQLQEIEAPSNPDEFDYKQFLKYHGINYECYAQSYSYRLVAPNQSDFLFRFANNSRKKLAAVLHDRVGGNEADIASAILLGYREDLSRSVLQNFVDSGVVHVICVAGLHVGIIFLLLNYIIVFPAKFKHGKLMSVLLILILLWLYALLTGLATPVLRATIMFSFLEVGKYFKKYTNTINTLAASAFLLLVSDPFSIAETGFQLSYLSVLGILVIYKPLLSLYNPASGIVYKIWELACVSISAQVAVFPLSLLYFHQFPNYFIFTNILVVPLLTIVVFSGIFFFIVCWIPFISTAAAWVLQKLLMLMNVIVSGASHLPCSVSKGIGISIFETVLLFLVIICILIFCSSKKFSFLLTGLSALAIFTGIRAANTIVHSRQQIFTVYNIPGKSAVAFISGTHSLMPFSKIDSNDISYHLQYNWWKLGVKEDNIIHHDTDAILLSGTLMLQEQFAQFNNHKIVFIKSNSGLPSNSKKLDIHCIVISGGYDMDMLSVKNAFNFDTLIFDSSIPGNKLKKWETECKQLNLHYYSVKTQGAYIENG